MLKKCSKCKIDKPLSEFNWKIRDVKRAVHCRECSRKYIRNHYESNKSYYLRKAKKRNIVIRKAAKEYIGNYLSTHPCIDCAESDILVLEFDHRDRKSKGGFVGVMVNNNATLKKVIEEISKCDVRCANCHRRKTEKENNSWKLNYKIKNVIKGARSSIG